MDYLEAEKAKSIMKKQSELCTNKLNNLLSNGIKWIEVADIYIYFDHFAVHCDRFYFTNGGVSVADVPITKLFCALQAFIL